MFKNLFRKKAAPVSEFMKAHDRYSFVFHILDKEDKSLCGRTRDAIRERTSSVSAEMIFESVNSEPGTVWCHSCTTTFLGEPIFWPGNLVDSFSSVSTK